MTITFERTYDVVVAGAGVAGVAAALASARAGMRTALVEKTVLLGGLATTGMVNVYLPLCDGRGRQAVVGIAEELLHLSARYGPGRLAEAWTRPDASVEARAGGRRYTLVFAPGAFVLALDEVLIEAGVDLWLDTLVCDAAVEAGRVTGLSVENKSGRGLLRAACLIDATGDADVAARAGAPCAETDNWLSLWASQASLAKARQAAADPETAPLLDMVRVGGGASGRGHPEGHPKYYGTDGASVSRFVLEGRRLLREHYATKQAEGWETDRHHLFPVALPSMAQFRTTRRIVGLATMGDEPHVPVPTSIGLVPDWRKAGPLWEVPYGALVAQGVRGLLAAGRCISAEREAWEVARVIPTAAMTGEVAGVAASLAIQRGTTPDQLLASDVQDALRARPWRAKIWHAKSWPCHISDIIRDE